MKFNLQRFAEGEGAEIAAPDIAADTETQSAEPEVKAGISESDLEEKMTSMFAKFKAQMDADYKKREAAAKKEAERLGKLSDEERQKAEIERMQKELDDRQAEFEREKLKYETAQVLGQRELGPEFVEFVLADTSDATLSKIKTLEKYINRRVELGINNALKGKAPASGGKIDVASASTGKVSRALIDTINSKKILI